MTSILSVENLDIFYDKFHAVKNISLSLNQKDIVVICGPSGSGKSTLIRSIAGLEKYKTGKIPSILIEKLLKLLFKSTKLNVKKLIAKEGNKINIV